MEKIVYILGAGASRDLEFPITIADLAYGVKSYTLHSLGPLSGGYFYDIEKLFNELKTKISILSRPVISKKLLEYTVRFYEERNKVKIEAKDLLENETTSKKLNIEDFYIFLEDEERKKGELDTRDTKETVIEKFKPSFAKLELEQYIYESLSMMCYYCFSLHHGVFAKHLCKIGGCVISFNWDVLLEDALVATQNWCFEKGYGINFNNVYYKYDKDKFLTYPSEIPVLVLKPHGSINWYRESKNARDENIYLVVPISWRLRGGTFNEHLKYYDYSKKSQQLESLIVPPGMKRIVSREIRERMQRELSEANTIISIGFSFNNKDEHIIEEFRDIKFKDSLKVLIINPDDGVVDKHKEVFKTENVVKVYNTFADFCNNSFKT